MHKRQACRRAQGADFRSSKCTGGSLSVQSVAGAHKRQTLDPVRGRCAQNVSLN